MVAAISPAIDYQLIDGRGRPDATADVPRCRAGPAGHGDAAHPSAQLAAASVVLLRPDRLPLARVGRSAADETLLARRAVRVRPGNQRRRARLGVLRADGGAGAGVYRGSVGARAAAGDEQSSESSAGSQ